MSKRRAKSAPKRRAAAPGKRPEGAGAQSQRPEGAGAQSQRPEGAGAQSQRAADANAPASPAAAGAQSRPPSNEAAPDAAAVPASSPAKPPAGKGDGEHADPAASRPSSEQGPAADPPRRAKETSGSGTGGPARTAGSRAATTRPPLDSGAEPRASRTRHAADGPSLAVQAGILAAVFAVVTLVAELAGAANLGVALGIGQIAFLIALVALLLRS